MRAVLVAIALTMALASVAGAADDVTQGATFHADPARSGNYVVPGLTWATAGRMQRVVSFDGSATGNVNAQPLYWRAPSAATGMVVIATD